jgi:tetrapyrrole methylase family protein/MazG family protein
MTDQQLSAVFLKFVEIIRALRDPKTGCPWDKEQTHDSLRTYLIEECFEAVEAIDSDDLNDLKEELGDVLLQVVLHAQIASESSIFTIEDVIQTVTDKMIRRHPHVFGTEKVEDSAHVLKNWEEIKKAEKASESKSEEVKTPFDGIPKSLPALLVSERIGEKAARVKFDWEEISGVLVKVKEEYNELFEALDKTSFSTLTKPSSTPIDTLPGHSPESLNNNHEIGKELGDCLFTLAQLARWLGYSSESLLRETNTRFIERYKRMQASIPPDISPADLQIAWKKAKEKI